MKTLILCMLLMSLSGFCQKNLIKNGELDNGTEFWNGDVLKANHFDKKNGSGSGMIVQFTGNEWKGADQVFSVPKGTYAIEFSAWIKSEAIEGGKDKWNAGIMTAAFTSGNGSEISSENIAELHGDQDWQLYKKIVLIPAGAKSVRLMLALAQTTGSILYDDVKAVTVSEENFLKLAQGQARLKQDGTVAHEHPPKFLVNGNFEDGLTNWNGSGKLVNVNPKEGSFCASVTSGSAVWAAIYQTADIPDGIKSIELSGWLKAKNISQGENPWNQGAIIIEFTTDGATKAVNDTNIAEVSGTTEWQFFKKKVLVPEGAKKYRIMIALNNAVGTLLADDFKVELNNNN